MRGRTHVKKALAVLPTVEIEDQRERMFARMSAIAGVLVRPSMGRYVFFSVPEPERIHRELSHDGVPVRDVSKYPRFANTLRVAVGTAEENEAFLEALARAIV